MFGSKKKESDSAAKKGMMPASTANSLNSLVKGTKVEGTVTSESDIRIDGTIIGTLTCKAKVIVGPTGVIEGDVKCENAVIEGRFEGDIKVNQLLHVKETANINGAVITGKLRVDPDAIFNTSSCQMGVQRSNVGSSQPAVKKVISAGTQTQSLGQKAS